MRPALLDADICFGAGIGENSLSIYESLLSRMRRNDCAINYHGLRRRILLNIGGSAYASLCTYISAVNFHLRRTGKRPLREWQKEYLRDLARGRDNLTRRPKIRGAITYPLLKDLVRWMSQEGATVEDQWMMLVCWGCALRRNQVMDLTWENVHLLQDGAVDIVVTKVHDPGRYRRPGAQALQERRRVHAKAACALRRTAEQRGVAAGRGAQRVFTNWNLKRMTGWIKDGSRALKWNTHLIWTLHSLRHGVAAEIFGKWKCLTRVRATTGHAGDVGAVRYARSNARRLEMMTRSNEERAAAAVRGRRG